MATKQISIPDIGTVTLYKRRGNRSMRLTIGSNGEVRVSLPFWLPYKAGEQFVLSKASWIAANVAQAEVELLHGHSIGKAHRLYFEKRPGGGEITSRVADNVVRISHPAVFEASDKAVQEAAVKACIRALRKEAETLLPQRLEALAIQTGYTYSGPSVKQLKARWGSCDTDKAITLNLFLMQLPWHLIDYVLVHELVHTKVMQHGAPFWAEMELHLPNARGLRKQMGSYHTRLSPTDRR
jgi:predicted metal-dependent hydrolase